VKEGNALHDRGDFDAAIAKYREALKISPQDGEVMYEIAFSLEAKKDYPAALEMAEAAARLPKRVRMLPVLLGNIYDEMGQPKTAIKTYRTAISVDPNFFLLHFNLGIAYLREPNYDLARECLENSAVLAPAHPGSHFQLGSIYRTQGYRVPAVLALAMALSLEPATGRSREALAWIDQFFEAGVEIDAQGNSKITVNPNTPKDEGDFSGLDVLIPMITVSEKLIPKAGGELEGPPQVHRLVSLLQSAGELDQKTLGRGFAAEYYVPFYAELVRNKVVPGLVALALAGSTSSEIATWCAQNADSAKRASGIAARHAWTVTGRPKLPPDGEFTVPPMPTPSR